MADFYGTLTAYRVSTDPVKSVTAEIIDDANGRSGMLDGVDDDIKLEILTTWEAIIRRRLS